MDEKRLEPTDVGEDVDNCEGCHITLTWENYDFENDTDKRYLCNACVCEENNNG